MKTLLLRMAYAVFALGMAVPMSAQVEPSIEGYNSAADSEPETHLIVPPAVSGVTLPIDTEAGERSSYLSGGVTVNSAYVRNVQPGQTSSAINDQSYSIWPVLILDQKTPRASRTMTYSSGFTLYQRTSKLDSINQNLDAKADFAASPRVMLSLQDSFRQNSNIFNQPLAFDGGGTSAITQSSGLVIPFAEEIKNDVSALFSYQFERFAMVGAKVGLGNLYFPNQSKVSGLYNSKAWSALAFYNHQISPTRYWGFIYEGARVGTAERLTTTQTQTFSFFYTLLSTRNLTLSVAAGPQYMHFSESVSSSYQKWTPSVRVGLGWVLPHLRITSDYSKDITAGQGLLGAYASDKADASLGLHLVRNWYFNSLAVYQNNKNSVPTSLQGYPGGQTISGTASAGYKLSEHMTMGFGYTRLHQNYSGLSPFTIAPDSDRAFGTLTYDFRRPLGR